MSARAEPDPVMWVTGMSVVLSHWYTSYADARARLDADGGYLLPYRNQFFVTTGEAIRELGLDPGDPDWAAIGRDWVRPADRSAWERLRARRQAALARPAETAP